MFSVLSALAYASATNAGVTPRPVLLNDMGPATRCDCDLLDEEDSVRVCQISKAMCQASKLQYSIMIIIHSVVIPWSMV